jgi:hypothetical protein
MARLTPKKPQLRNSKHRLGGKRCSQPPLHHRRPPLRHRRPPPRHRRGHLSPTVTDAMATPRVRSFHLAIQLTLPLITQTLLAKTRRVLPLAAARLLLGLRIGLRCRRCSLCPRPQPLPEAAKCHRSGGPQSRRGPAAGGRP